MNDTTEIALFSSGLVACLPARACLHVPSPSMSNFIIVPMETDCLTNRMGRERSVSIDTM